MPTRRNQCRTESYRTFHLAHFVNFPNEPRSHADRRLSQARPCEVARCGSAGRPEWERPPGPFGRLALRQNDRQMGILLWDARLTENGRPQRNAITVDLARWRIHHLVCFCMPDVGAPSGDDVSYAPGGRQLACSTSLARFARLASMATRQSSPSLVAWCNHSGAADRS